MKLESIKGHWESWAKEFGTGLRATTKAPSLKKLEIDALQRAMTDVGFKEVESGSILEVGCGNGYNCFALAQMFPQLSVTGVDLVPEMIAAANELREEGQVGNLQFFTGNLLELRSNDQLLDRYDLIFTDRCIINLNTDDLQKTALDQIASKLRPGGHAILIENPAPAHRAQNELRMAVGLPARPVAEFNHFLSENVFLAHADDLFELLWSEDFISLHDIVLYVLLPMINGGQVDYGHPLVAAAADLSVQMNARGRSLCGAFGQNRMYVFRSKSIV